MLFLNLTGIDSTATNNYVNSIQAEMTARAGLEYAVYVLNMDKYGADSVVYYNNNSYHYIGSRHPRAMTKGMTPTRRSG